MSVHAKDIADIPLKPSVETFVDDPTCLADISIDELIFDLTHGIKDINKLHTFHAILILLQTLQDIIKLQQSPESFQEFRRLQLEKYSIEVDLTAVPTQNIPSPLSPTSTKVDHLSNSFSLNSEELEFNEVTPESPDSGDEDDPEDDPEEPKYIPVETLLKTCPVCSDEVENPMVVKASDSFRAEYKSSQKSKIVGQDSHLLKTFNLLKVPSLSLQDFLIRIKTYSSSIPVTSYIHSALMMFKLSILLDIVPLTEINVYRFTLASIRCSTKMLEDIYQKQKSFATVGGVSPKDLLKMEMGFLYLTSFKLIIGEDLLNQFLTSQFVELRSFCKQHLDNEQTS